MKWWFGGTLQGGGRVAFTAEPASDRTGLGATHRWMIVQRGGNDNGVSLVYVSRRDDAEFIAAQMTKRLCGQDR